MTTSAHNPLTIDAVRAHPGRLLAAAGGLAAAIACAVAIGQAPGGGTSLTDEPVTGARPDPAILHHHWLNTADPAAAEQIRRQADRFHHR